MLVPLNYNTLLQMFNRGAFDQILQKADRYLALFPTDIKILLVIGKTYLAKHLFYKALDVYKIILEAIPAEDIKFRAETEYNIGCIYAKCYDHRAALKHFLASKSIYDEFELNFVTLSLSLKNLQKYRFAKKILIEGLVKFPNSGVIKYNLANLLQDYGDFEKALSLYREVLNIEDSHSKAHFEYSRLKVYLAKDRHILQMQKALKFAKLPEDASYLSFGLGNAHANLKSYNKAFTCWADGNAYFRSKINFDINKEAAQFDRFKLWHETINQDENTDNSRICFIIGMPRSGTSLIEQILSGHSQIYGAGELMFLEEAIIKAHDTNQLNPDFVNIKHHYNNRIREITKTKKIITDKNPLNFRFVGLIKTCFPNAKIIHVHRNPKSVCFSIFKHLFPVGCHFSFNLDEIFSYYDLYKKHMNHWNALYDDIINVFYEDLTKDPEQEISSLLSACGLGFEQQCIKIENNKRVVQTITNSQIRASIKKASDETINYPQYRKAFDLKFGQ